NTNACRNSLAIKRSVGFSLPLVCRYRCSLLFFYLAAVVPFPDRTFTYVACVVYFLLVSNPVSQVSQLVPDIISRSSYSIYSLRLRTPR
uniref:Uncharacterized protein n=1 Tax=Anopheles albimanus TaxID=7167 RepID=A0A182FYW6_ANOAL